MPSWVCGGGHDYRLARILRYCDQLHLSSEMMSPNNSRNESSPRTGNPSHARSEDAPFGDVTALYRLLVESVTDYAILVLDSGGHIRSWNPGARRLKGYSESEIIGKHFSTFQMHSTEPLPSGDRSAD